MKNEKEKNSFDSFSYNSSLEISREYYFLNKGSMNLLPNPILSKILGFNQDITVISFVSKRWNGLKMEVDNVTIKKMFTDRDLKRYCDKIILKSVKNLIIKETVLVTDVLINYLRKMTNLKSVFMTGKSLTTKRLVLSLFDLVGIESLTIRKESLTSEEKKEIRSLKPNIAIDFHEDCNHRWLEPIEWFNEKRLGILSCAYISPLTNMVCGGTPVIDVTISSNKMRCSDCRSLKSGKKICLFDREKSPIF